MSISSSQEYELTRTKLEGVLGMITRLENRRTNTGTEAASIRSMHAYANQLIEEIKRYEAEHHYAKDVGAVSAAN